VSSVKKKPAVAVAHAASPSASDSQPMSGGGAAGAHMQPAVHVPRDAVLDFKLWMKQKQAATAAATSLAPLSEVPEAIAEDDEVCAVNRRVLRTCCSQAPRSPAPAAPHHPHRVRRQCSMRVRDSSRIFTFWSTPRSFCISRQNGLAARAAAAAPNSSGRLSASQARSELARISGAVGANFAFASKFPRGAAAEELPVLPCSFLPRELDPLEAVRVQSIGSWPPSSTP